MKTIKILGICLMSAALVAGCKKDEKEGKKPPPSGKTTTKDTPKDTPPKDTPKDAPKKWTSADTQKRFTDCWLAFNAKDDAKFTDCYGDSGELIITDSMPPMAGKGEAALAIAKQWWTASSDIKGAAMLTLINGENYAACYNITGTNDGEMMGMKATGKKLNYFGSQMGSMKDGKLVKDWHLSDMATVMHQLGVAKNPMAPDAETALPAAVIIAKNDEAEKANVELIRKAFAGMNEGKDPAEWVHDDIFFRWVPSKEEMKGKAAWMKGFGEYAAMHESMKKDLKSAWGAGDWVVTMSETSGKLAKDMPGTKKTKGKEYKTHQIEFFQIADGKVKSHWVFDNSMAMMIQIGAIDPPKAPGKGG